MNGAIRTRGVVWAGMLVLASVSWAAAQVAGRVSGQLTDAVSLKAVQAPVTIEELRKETRAGADGTFGIEGVPPGTYHLIIAATGFVPQRREITVGPTELKVDAALDPELHYTEVVSVSPNARNQFESYQP